MSDPAITVKDVWRSALPAGTELLGGGGGLDRRVEWACALRTKPPAFEAVKGGEVAFVPVASIRVLDERLDLVQVMTTFADKGGAAVAALGDVSRDSIALADRLVLPLLQLPEGTHVADAHQICIRFILDARTHLHERASGLQTALMQLALAGAGRDGIVEHVATTTGLTAVWLDAEGTVRHTASDELDLVAPAVAGLVPALRRWAETTLVQAADPPVRELQLPAAGLHLLASPIPSRQGVAGFVGVIGSDGEMDQLTRLAVSRAASACAIEVDRERAVQEAHERLEGELATSLLSGVYASEALASDRLRRLGLAIGDEPVAVFVMRGTGMDAAGWQAIVAGARALLERREVPALLTVHGGALCGIIAARGDDAEISLQQHVDAVRSHAQQLGAVTVTAGIGRTASTVAELRLSYRDAEQALNLGLRVGAAGRSIRMSQLGLHRLLSTMAQSSELLDFYEHTVGSLVRYDARHGGELMATLDAFFACNGSPTDAAQRLSLHRNTVLYRLRRIEEVGRLRLDDPATRLNLHLCLRIGDVLPDSGRFGRSAQAGTGAAGANRRSAEP
ncbi:MAG TPA: helix-turn-helix domain-containing protein, partial [Dehalococcoidia bacterium]|nr:helix-turn-helix domain-containing protein [Dehalococcoidia bacterium]